MFYSSLGENITNVLGIMQDFRIYDSHEPLTVNTRLTMFHPIGKTALCWNSQLIYTRISQVQHERCGNKLGNLLMYLGRVTLDSEI